MSRKAPSSNRRPPAATSPTRSKDEDKIKRYNLTGEFIFFDVEGMEVMFGGSTVLGATGGDYDGDNIGYAVPDYNAADTNGVYLEIITRASGEGAGDCVSAAGGFPTYHGHMFGKVKMTPGERTFENDVARLAFTGKARSNPALYDGPWKRLPGRGVHPDHAVPDDRLHRRRVRHDPRHDRARVRRPPSR